MRTLLLFLIVFAIPQKSAADCLDIGRGLAKWVKSDTRLANYPGLCGGLENYKRTDSYSQKVYFFTAANKDSKLELFIRSSKDYFRPKEIAEITVYGHHSALKIPPAGLQFGLRVDASCLIDHSCSQETLQAWAKDYFGRVSVLSKSQQQNFWSSARSTVKSIAVSAIGFRVKKLPPATSCVDGFTALVDEKKCFRGVVSISELLYQ